MYEHKIVLSIFESTTLRAFLFTIIFLEKNKNKQYTYQILQIYGVLTCIYYDIACSGGGASVHSKMKNIPPQTPSPPRHSYPTISIFFSS